MSSELRNELWSTFYGLHKHYREMSYEQQTEDSSCGKLYKKYWRYLCRPLDEIPWLLADVEKVFKEVFLYKNWSEVYDFIDFIAEASSKTFKDLYCKLNNEVLEQHNSAYRFIDGRLEEITSELEIEEIEKTLNDTSSHSGIKEHLKSALAHLSNRNNPDYRNSIKESISAVEATCQLFSKNEKATLGDGLKILEKQGLHSALKEAFSKLYGYTSDEKGIRHAMIIENNQNYNDAKFMLVACSAFINYLFGTYAMTSESKEVGNLTK